MKLAAEMVGSDGRKVAQEWVKEIQGAISSGGGGNPGGMFSPEKSLSHHGTVESGLSNNNESFSKTLDVNNTSITNSTSTTTAAAVAVTNNAINTLATCQQQFKNVEKLLLNYSIYLDQVVEQVEVIEGSVLLDMQDIGAWVLKYRKAGSDIIGGVQLIVNNKDIICMDCVDLSATVYVFTAIEFWNSLSSQVCLDTVINNGFIKCTGIHIIIVYTRVVIFCTCMCF